MHSLIQVCAESLANKNWRALGARSAQEARGFVAAAVKRRLGLTVAREMARHRLRRVPAIGVPNAALSGPARFQRAMDRRHGVDEPLDRPPAFVPEEFFAFQALAAQGGAFLISRKVGGPELQRLREGGGRKQKQENRVGARGPASKRWQT